VEPATLNETQTAQYLGFARNTLAKYVKAGKVPGPVLREGKFVRWSRATLDQWLAEKQTKEESQT
jgi:excisionase family DNA binding protein